MHRVRPCGGLSAELWPPLFCQIGFGTSTEDLPLPDATSGTCWTARIAAEKAASLTTQLLSFGRRQVLVLRVFSASVREPKFDAGASFLLPGVSSPVRMHSAPVSVFVDVRRFR